MLLQNEQNTSKHILRSMSIRIYRAYSTNACESLIKFNGAARDKSHHICTVLLSTDFQDFRLDAYFKLELEYDVQC